MCEDVKRLLWGRERICVKAPCSLEGCEQDNCRAVSGDARPGTQSRSHRPSGELGQGCLCPEQGAAVPHSQVSLIPWGTLPEQQGQSF